MLKATCKTNPHRIWLHTDEWDHPNAIRTYERVGFVVYKQQPEKAHTPMQADQ